MPTFIPLIDFCHYYQIETRFVLSLEEYGLVRLTTNSDTTGIDADDLNKLEQLVRLHRDLQINLEGLHVVSQLMQRLEEKQAELTSLRNRLRLYEGNTD